ncbi:MAG: hypothetical protein WKG52_00280 [Variovorax sp.]
MMNPWFLLAVLGLGGAIANKPANAGVGRDRATGQAIWDAAVSGRSTTIGGSNGSMRIIGPAAPSVAGSTPGSARISGSGTVPVADKQVPGVNMSGEVAKEAVVGAVTGCLTGGLVGCVLGVATPLALAYVANSGLRQNPQSGAPERSDPGVCSTAPCYEYRYHGSLAFRWTRQAACTDFMGYIAAFNPPSYTWRAEVAPENEGAQCRLYYKSAPTANEELASGTTAEEGTRSPSSVTWYPATPQDVRDALYNNDPPAPIVDELARHGNINWTLGDPTRIVSGPASVSGPKETTSNPDGSTSTRQTNTPLSYSGPTITAGPTTTTTTTKDPQGNTTGTTTTTTTPGTEAEPAPEPPPTDTPLGPIPQLYTPKFPDGMTGVWATRKAELMASPLVSLKDQMFPAVGSTGACPAWQLPVNVAWVDFGTYNVAPPCWIWDFAKVIVILSAALLARALIFGG